MFIKAFRPVSTLQFRDFSHFEQEISDLLGGVLGGFVQADRFYPAIDLAEYENESVVVAELPGVRKEDVRISLQDGVLTLSGERKPQTVPEGSGLVHSETRTGGFSRAIRLPHEVKASGISAELQDGVLRIVLPKAEEARPMEIKVNYSKRTK